MSTDPDTKLNGAAEPFRRTMTWGRPPATVFRTGPLPKGGALPPMTGPGPSAPPRRPAGPGILSGSMIPRAEPVPRDAGLVIARAPEPRPVQSPPDAAARPNAAVESRPPTPIQPAAAVAAPVSAAVEPAHRTSSRTPLYAGLAVAAVAVLAFGGWMLTRGPGATPEPAASPADVGPDDVAPALLTPIAESAPAGSTPVEPAPGPVAAPATPVPAATEVAEPRPVPSVPSRVASPVAEPAAAPVVPPPVEIAPAGPPPTAAEPPPSDPNAPIATRPQPLD